MSDIYLNLDAVMDKLIELRNTGNYHENMPVYFEDSSGYNYEVTGVILEDGFVIIK